MSIRSTIFLFDENHWGKDRESVKQDILKICDYAECLFDNGGDMMIFYIGREMPESFKSIRCDYMMYMNDHNQPYPIRF